MKKKLRKIGKFLPTKVVLHIDFLRSYKRLLNLKKPKYVGEKIQWIKLNGNLERYGKYVDKYEVRKFITDTIGEEYLPNLIGIYNTVEDINFDKLPNQFVLKMTNGSGGNIICKNKNLIDEIKVKQQLEKWYKEEFYKYTKEYQYKNVKSRIICEEYLEDETGSLRDYKLHCSKGIVHIIEVHTDRYINHKENYYDAEWNELDVHCKVEKVLSIDRPVEIDEMKILASKLSEVFSYVRVDFYLVKGKIYFGELTFTPANGTDPFYPYEKDLEIANMIDLNNYI